AIDHDGAIAYADVDAVDVSSVGTRQLEVRTDTTATTPEARPQTASPEPPIPTATEPAPPPAPQPAAEVPASADRSGVYAAVPAGGTQPEELARVIPRYPAMARRAGIQGAVVVRGIV